MRRLLHALGTLTVLAGGMTAGAVAMLASPAGATTCAAGTSCSMTGTVTLSSGALTLTTPTSLSWSAALTGADQSVVDTNSADQLYTVDDASGSGAGWSVTVAATTFTNGSATFPDTGSFATNGSTSSVTATTPPSATCTGSCTLPTNAITYPVAITTAATAPTPVTIYNAASGTGLGTVVIGNDGGSTAPVGWWVNIPGSASSGAYTSTITMTVTSGAP